MSRGPTVPRATWVVVPALDECRHITACLDALAVAADRVAGAVHVIVVDDGSTDGTAELAEAQLDGRPGSHHVVRGPQCGVGPARRLGLELALRLAGDAVHDGGKVDALVATTDADSRVAPRWLRSMHRLLDAGNPVIAGDIRLEATTDPRLVAARDARLATRLAALPPAERPASHPHFAAASLGFAAAALTALAPIPSPRTLEDEAMLRRCRALGIPVLRAADVLVSTSARTVGRARHGLADALADDLAAIDLAGAGARPRS